MDAIRLSAPASAPAAPTIASVRDDRVQVVLMGPPGAGKGTQAGTVADLGGVVHVASGDLFRESVKNGNEYGLQIKEYMDSGKLVPDDLTVKMVVARLDEPDGLAGFILDGFPRSLGQARALDEMLEREGRRLERVINIDVPEETLLARLSGRWLCSECHASYHTVYNPPRVAGVCDRCGGALYQREDDTLETARDRLAVYRKETVPVLDYYRDRGILVDVDGDQPIDEVTRALYDALPLLSA